MESRDRRALLRIGQAASRLELNPRTLRYYEKVGLLPRAERTEAGFRLYSERDLERVAFIRKAQRLGLSLGEIREIIAFRDRQSTPCEYVRSVIDAKRSEVERRISELRELQQVLDRLAERAIRLPLDDPQAPQVICHLIEQ